MSDVTYTLYVLGLDTVGELWLPIMNVTQPANLEDGAGVLEKQLLFHFDVPAEEEATALIANDIAVQLAAPKAEQGARTISHLVGPFNDPIEYLMVGSATYPTCKIFFVVLRRVVTQSVELRAYAVNYEGIGKRGVIPICNLGSFQIMQMTRDALAELDVSTIESTNELRDALANGDFQLYSPSGRSI